MIVVTTSAFQAHQAMVASTLAQNRATLEYLDRQRDKNKATLEYLDRQRNPTLPGASQPAAPAATTPAATAASSSATPAAPQVAIVVVAPPNSASSPEAAPVKKGLGAATNKRLLAALNQGRRLAKARNIRGAERAFRRIIDGAPGTAIAAEAQKELDSLPSH
ncbi:MAG TPA: hypothetical protein VMR25_25805 [Planctomycetaceae bacterium]|nr:hypothetical protein [Planctomycetaceae bacterium]